MMKKLLIIIVALILFNEGSAQKDGDALTITPNGHYLQHKDGKPFFWLGDTGWELFHRLTLPEIENYLNNRQLKGFNVIQAVILAELDGLRVPNRYGELPLLNMDPETPNEKYFQMVDTVVRMAADRNMFMALLPAWGDKVTLHFGGRGPVIFNNENAYKYGEYLGKRYRDFSNIVWVLGGDRPPKDACDNYINIYRNMAKGIRDGSGKHTLMSFHPGGSIWESSPMIHNEEWLDFNMIQSGHAELDQPVWKNVIRDWNLKPAKPVIDSEPCYEDLRVNPWTNWTPERGYFDDYDVRRQIYRSVFAGGFGVTYGQRSVWQFYSPEASKLNDSNDYWYNVLDRPGAFQAGYLKKLIESRPYTERIPDSTIIINGQGEKGEHMEAFRDERGRYLMVYLPVGKKVSVNTGSITSKEIKPWWFNPKNNSSVSLKKIKNSGKVDLIPPTSGKYNDWVLVIDNLEMNYDKPGNELTMF